MASTFDLLGVESPQVRREMQRLHDVHGVFAVALRLSVRERFGPDASVDVVEDEVQRLIGSATKVLLG